MRGFPKNRLGEFSTTFRISISLTAETATAIIKNTTVVATLKSHHAFAPFVNVDLSMNSTYDKSTDRAPDDAMNNNEVCTEETYEEILARKRGTMMQRCIRNNFKVFFRYVNDETNSRKEREPSSLVHVCETAKIYAMFAIDLVEKRPLCELERKLAESQNKR